MRWSAFVVAAAVMLPAAAPAALAPSETGRAAFARFKALDKDSDRRLTRGELQLHGRESAADTLFRLLDGDGDGELTVKEMERATGGAALGRFQAYDVDQNGVVVRREFPTSLDPLLFTALDRDGDGALELRDLRPAFAGWRPSPPATPVPARPKADRDERPWCWVPAIGDDGWALEAPVVTGGCRTTG